MEGAGSWDVLDWTKIEPLSRHNSGSMHGMGEFLLESEVVIAQGHGVVLINTDEAGTLTVTNFRLVFVSEVSWKVIELGTIPLATIEKFNKLALKPSNNSRQYDKVASRRLLQVYGKDLRILIFGFRPRTKQRSIVFEALSKYSKPSQLGDLYTFTCSSSNFSGSNSKVRLLKEYYRLIGKGSFHFSCNVTDDILKVSNDWWRITTLNSRYTLCATYPYSLLIPKCISDEEAMQSSIFRARGRLPVITWCHPGSGAVLARSSQPLVGLMNNTSNADEKLVAGFCTQISVVKGSRRKLYIVDARARKNAFANCAMGGGSESSSNYVHSEVVFFGIDNIHAMRESLTRLREYLDTHGTTSSDGMSSFLRNGGWTWGGGNLSSMSASVSTLGGSGWLSHIQSILAGSAWIAARVALESASVLVHCSDGWDRTTQLVSLACLLLDPYYRTFQGFQALVEKDWLAFGHPFSDRMGIPTASAKINISSELTRQSSLGNASTSPVRSSSVDNQSSGGGPSHSQSNNCSPIFLQWVDCIAQLLRVYPCAFEFSSAFLVDMLDCVLSCRFGNFLCNSEKERRDAGIFDNCGCMWMHLADKRSAEIDSHVHYNPFYDRHKHDGPLLPPAAALAPTLWPQYHLRWACPLEAKAGELQAQWHVLNKKYQETVKAKELAESKAEELKASIESLDVELLKERQISSSATAKATRAFRENLSIKRAVQSLGCKVHFSSSGDDGMQQEGGVSKTRASLLSSQREIGAQGIQDEKMDASVMSPRRELRVGGFRDVKADLSVSISAVEDAMVHDNLTTSVCEALCPFGRRGACNWPDTACVQLGSQFVGLKANFEAFDRLSIQDCYFGSD